MQYEELFEIELARRTGGRRFDPERYPSATVKLFEERTKRVKALLSDARKAFPRLPPIHFGLIDGSRVGACAFGDRDLYFIGFTSATEFFLTLLFNRMLADRRLFPQVGKPNVEDDDLSKLTGVGESFPDMETLAPECLRIPQPRDKTRRQFAVHLGHLVAEFIVMHELAHILQGHVEYYDHYLNLGVLSVPGRPTTDRETDLVQQSLELFADNWAVSNGLFSLLSRVQNPSRHLAPLDQFYDKPIEALHHWLFAASAFCRLFGDEALAHTDLAIGDHPPWRFRQRRFIEDLFSFVKHERTGGIFGSMENVGLLVNRTLIDAEEAMSVITGEEISVQGLADGNHPFVRNHTDNLVRVWKEDLRDELVQFAHVDLPA